MKNLTFSTKTLGLDLNLNLIVVRFIQFIFRVFPDSTFVFGG